MHHYPHHISDFNNATRHLTRIERSVYRDLIDLYYDTEEPLKSDSQMLCRLIIATSETEATAVEQVLNEFFILTDSGYEHHRCNIELKKYAQNNSNKAKAGRASAKARKLAKSKLKSNSTGVQQVLGACSTGVHNQEPSTINQEPVNKKSKQKRFAPPTREELIQHCNEKQITVNVDKFLNHYESNGWKIGKNKMKSWKATLSNWGIRDAETKSKPSNGKSLSGNEQRAENDRVANEWLEKQRLDRESRDENGDALEGTSKLI